MLVIVFFGKGLNGCIKTSSCLDCVEMIFVVARDLVKRYFHTAPAEK